MATFDGPVSDFPRRIWQYNPVGMLRFRTSILTRLSAVSGLFGDLLRLVNAAVRSQGSLVAENLFLRKQLAFYQERKVRPRRLTDAARLALLLRSRWFNWKDALIIVKPETLIGWHRKGFRLFWRWIAAAFNTCGVFLGGLLFVLRMKSNL
jgi:hypothetical protein